jgi:hypothetical protein
VAQLHVELGLLEGRLLAVEGKIHRADPDFGSTVTVSTRNYQSNCWVNWKINGPPCEYQVWGRQ